MIGVEEGLSVCVAVGVGVMVGGSGVSVGVLVGGSVSVGWRVGAGSSGARKVVHASKLKTKIARLSVMERGRDIIRQRFGGKLQRHLAGVLFLRGYAPVV